MNLSKRFQQTILPFLIIGAIIALIVVLFIFLAYVALWGIVIGAVLYAFTAIKRYFFPNKYSQQRVETPASGGRIIEHDEI